MNGYRRIGPKAPVATTWESASDITGTGTSEQYSSVTFVLGNLPGVASVPMIEVEFTHQLTGGTGSVSTWVKLNQQEAELNTSAPGAVPSYYTGEQQATGVSRDRRILITMPVLTGRVTTNFSQMHVVVTAAGGAADSEYTVSGIRARMIYTPL